MNDQHNQDQSFGDDKLSAIYRQSRIEEPPMKLDSAILSDARRAVEKRAKWWRAAWVTPIATVSVAVLAVAIGMINKSMVEKQEAYVEPAADMMMRDEVPEESLEMKALGNAPATRQSAPAPTSAPSASGMAAPMAEGVMEQQTAPSMTAPAPAPAAKPQMMMKRPAPQLEERRRESVAPAPQQFNEMDAGAALAKPKDADELLAPEAWLEKIRQLKAAGKSDEAARELELFRKAYPDYELPDDF